MQFGDNKLTTQLYKGLPPHYNDIVTAIRINKSNMTFTQALKLLTECEHTIGARRQSKSLVATAKKAQAQALAASTDNANNGRGKHRGYRRGYQARETPLRTLSL